MSATPTAKICKTIALLTSFGNFLVNRSFHFSKPTEIVVIDQFQVWQFEICSKPIPAINALPLYKDLNEDQ